MRAAQALRILVVEHEAVAAAVLGLVHRDVRVGQQPGHVAAVERVERDADGGREAGDALLVGRLEAVVAQRVEQVLGHLRGVAAQRLGQMYGVLVPAQAEHLAVELA